MAGHLAKSPSGDGPEERERGAEAWGVDTRAERPQVADSGRATLDPEVADDVAFAVVAIADRGAANPLEAGVLGRDVDRERRVVVGDLDPHRRDGGSLGFVERRRVV